MANDNVAEYLSQDETIYTTWVGGNTQYAATDRRIGMLRDSDFRDLPYSEVEAVRTTTKTVGGVEWNGVTGLVKLAVSLGLGVLGVLFVLSVIFNLLSGMLVTAIILVIPTLIMLWAGLQGYNGWKRRKMGTESQPFVVFELGQTTTVDVDAFGHADVSSEKEVLEIPVPDESTMKTVTSNVR